MSNFEQDFRTKVIAKAWKDPEFKKKLLSNPKAAFKEMGIEVPDNVNLRVIEDTKDTFTFVLPATPSKLEKLSDAELSGVSGAAISPFCSTGAFACY